MRRSVFHRRVAEDLRQLTARDPLEELELPEALRRVNEPLGPIEIRFGRGLEHRDRELVKSHADAGIQPL